MSNYRHELKYIINRNMAEILKKRLALVMNVDKNSINKDRTYFIRSLYFDNLFSDSYLEKLDGIEFRKKYRIRLYNNDSAFIRLECKQKHNNMTLKKQQLISKDLCSKILSNDIGDIKISDDLLSEFILDIKLKQLIPSIIVDYNRLAYTYPLSEVRVTFDSNIKSGRYQYDIFDIVSPATPVISDEMVVLEVKFNEVLPEHIAIILSSVPTFRQAVSKFAICRSVK